MASLKKALPLLSVLALVACVRSKPDQADSGAQASPPASVSPPVATTAATNAPFTVTQCESLLVDAERQLHSARSRAPAACKKDEDCKIIETSACVPACADRAIAVTAVPEYSKTREQLRQSSCKLWNDAECARTTPKPVPTCPEMKAVCNKAGQCDVAPK